MISKPPFDAMTTFRSNEALDATLTFEVLQWKGSRRARLIPEGAIAQAAQGLATIARRAREVCLSLWRDSLLLALFSFFTGVLFMSLVAFAAARIR